VSIPYLLIHECERGGHNIESFEWHAEGFVVRYRGNYFKNGLNYRLFPGQPGHGLGLPGSRRGSPAIAGTIGKIRNAQPGNLFSQGGVP
jgi:hypothetical protein